MEVIEEQSALAAQKNITLSLDLVDPPNSQTQGQVQTQELAQTQPLLIDTWFTLQGDWNQLVRLFTNLIGNAVQYTPAGGQVSVQLQRIAIGKGQSLASRLSLASGLQVKVSDTGIGIPASALPRLFDRFYRVDPARTHTATTPAVETPTGSGLGLAIAAAIVENHQGQIQAESTLHQGTTFTVTLPLSVEF
jgi:OmpR-family two-component system manganese-sensing sensor histidine kinase